MDSSKSIPFFPDQASNFAPQVDGLYAYLVLVSIFFSVVIAFVIVYFAVKYRHRPHAAHTPDVGHSHGGLLLEIAWSVIPLGLCLVMFAWGASIFFNESMPPADSMQIYVTGKQWMWKVQHMEGPREINELHIPLGRNIRLTMTSEDVIHDFYIPAFRTKSDVLPGRYTTEWFRPTKVGKFHLFCAEYCGTEHSGMVGSIYVMEPRDFEAWLSGGGGGGNMAQKGEALFTQLGCITCHVKDGKGRCPSLVGIFGKKQDLQGGSSIIVTEDYIKESILIPDAKVVAGYQPIMPTFKGLVTDEGINQLIQYVKSLGSETNPGNTPPATPETAPAAKPAAVKSVAAAANATPQAGQ